MDEKFKDKIIMKAKTSTVVEIPFTGSPAPKATWKFKGQDMPGAKKTKVDAVTSMTALTLDRVTRSDAGDYVCTIVNPNGKTTVKIQVIVIGEWFISISTYSNTLFMHYTIKICKDKLIELASYIRGDV